MPLFHYCYRLFMQNAGNRWETRDMVHTANDSHSHRAYYLHVLTYGVVNAILFLIDAFQGDDWWFFWPATIWGVALIGHTLNVLGLRISYLTSA